jgi:hypothetical protein
MRCESGRGRRECANNGSGLIAREFTPPPVVTWFHHPPSCSCIRRPPRRHEWLAAAGLLAWAVTWGERERVQRCGSAMPSAPMTDSRRILQRQCLLFLLVVCGVLDCDVLSSAAAWRLLGDDRQPCGLPRLGSSQARSTQVRGDTLEHPYLSPSFRSPPTTVPRFLRPLPRLRVARKSCRWLSACEQSERLTTATVVSQDALVHRDHCCSLVRLSSSVSLSASLFSPSLARRAT